MDLNNAHSERAGIEFVWDRLVPGAFIYIDDYGANGYENTRDFYDNFAKTQNCRILKTPFCSGIMQKL